MCFRLLILIFLNISPGYLNIGYWMFQAFDLHVMGVRQTNKKSITTTYNEFFRARNESKKSICLVHITKWKFSKPAVSPQSAPQHVKETFLDMYSSLTFPNQFPRTNIKLKIAQKMTNKAKNQIRNYFNTKLL